MGHITRDVLPGGRLPGGSVFYSATTALRLGLRPAVVTRCGVRFLEGVPLRGVAVQRIPSRRTTTFHNCYDGETRTQLLRSHAGPIDASHIPPLWRAAPLVHLGPVAQEVDPSVACLFPGATVLVTPQGWMRQWDAEGHLSPRAWAEAEAVLPHATVLVLSEEDVRGDGALVETCASRVPVLALTLGRRGAKLHWQGQWHFIPPFAVREVDPTGAGDVFAAALLVRYSETRDALVSARFAACAAALSVQGLGASAIPTRAQVEALCGAS